MGEHPQILPEPVNNNLCNLQQTVTKTPHHIHVEENVYNF